MQASAGYRRPSVMVLAVILVGSLFALPSAVAQAGGSEGKAARRAPIEHFLALSTSTNENSNPILLGFGPIHAKGVDRAVTNHKDIFRFPKGSLVVRHHRVAGSRHHDRVTCLTRIFERGTYRVVRGTRAYAGAHGRGHYRLRVQFVACQHSRPRALMIEIRAHGPLHL